MSEILFRGKRTDNKQWIEGFYVLIGEKNPDAYILKDNVHMVRVAHKSICEYTGLTDKNGKKIFEGDVVKNIDGAFLVCWDKEKCAFIMRFLEYPYETLYLEEMWEDSEIIGNIHDNPELLKGGEG